MANAKRKKRTTRKRNTKKRTTTQTQSNILRVCLLLCGMALSLIALMRLGTVGLLVYQLASFFVGSLAMLLLLLIFIGCFFFLFRKKSIGLPSRYCFAFLFFVLAWILFVAIREYKDLPNPSMFTFFKETLFNFGKIVTAKQSTQSGLLGALLYDIFVRLFDVAGSYVVTGLFFILGLVLTTYDYFIDWLKNREEKPKKVKEKKEPKKELKRKIPSKRKEKEVEQQDLWIDLDDVEDIEPFQEVIVPEPEDSIETKDPEPVPNEKKESPAPEFGFGKESYKDYKCPPLSVLDNLERKSKNNANATSAKEQGRKLIEILNEFGVEAQLVGIHIGPSVTKFEIKPELGVRVNKISNLQYDLKMGLAATDIRIEAPIPGKNAVGIEIPNVEKTMVQMKDLMRGIPSAHANKKLLFCLGKDLLGTNVYGFLNKMPHLLIAGATGSGKSVCVNAIICSFLMRTRPDELKMILIDPKKVEFTPYKDVPHLIAPVITDGDMANKALKVVVSMMDHRYDLFGELGVRNITAYNAHVRKFPEESLKPLPSIVVIIDELADLMLVAAKEVEASIQRITQLARAAGIHLIVATQRPSVDVITGVIKANIPSRIAFAVSQSVDSRTILDQAGAERLLGNGDMLYLPNGETSPQRIQGVFIKDEEVNRISEAVKAQGKPQYDDAFIQLRAIASQGGEVQEISSDPLYSDVKSFVIQSRKASTSLIQRRFSVGYSRAARLIDTLELEGIIGPAQGSKPREILVHNTLEDGSNDV